MQNPENKDKQKNDAHTKAGHKQRKGKAF